MDAPPCGRAVSDAPPHSGLSPIAVFRHYYSRHLICIVHFTRRGPSHPRALPRFPATTASSDSSLRFRYTQFSRVPLLNFPNMRPSYAPPRPRSPNRIGHEVLTSHIKTCWSRGFRVNETLRRRFTCVAAYFFVRQDSRTSVALCTARPPNRMSISLRFSSFQLIGHAELCLAYLYHSYSTIRVPLLSQPRSFRSGDQRKRVVCGATEDFRRSGIGADGLERGAGRLYAALAAELNGH